MTEGLRILTIEDDAPTAAAFRDALAESGHEVRIASDGRKALAELAGWRPDVIVLDLLLPAVSGHTLLRYLRELPEYRQIPVVVVSGALPTLQQLDGANAVLRKPFDIRELLTLVERLRPRTRPN
ncbi:MAG: response regulator [Chloroflexota bacterium]|nr:response regulator [Chloroflexota bacterium]MDE3193016.1 response regulator [Chloroflexota bacterium]